MTSLAAILETLHGSGAAFRSLHARGTSSRSEWELWWAGPRRVRHEWASNVAVVDGAHWWLKQPDGKIVSNESDPQTGVGLGPGIEILHGRELLGDVLLEAREEVEIAGRKAILLHATPTEEDGWSRWWDYRSPFDIALDARTGVVLQTPHVAVEQIAFDDSLPDELFTEPTRRGRWRR